MNNFVAAIRDPQQLWLAAVLDFETVNEDSALLTSLLRSITLYDIYLYVNIANLLMEISNFELSLFSVADIVKRIFINRYRC